MSQLQLKEPAPRRLRHFTPLRYPGGKGKLASYIKLLMEENQLLDGEYAEPYCGGAGIALELLFQDYVSRIHLNDLSRPIYAFWLSVLEHTDRLCEMIRNTPLTLVAWDTQKRVFLAQDSSDDLELGFATFYLNRTNRSGILNGGIIGGRDQSGPWKIDARFNREELIHRVEAIAKIGGRISLTSLDALEFVKAGIAKWPSKSLIYLDPPYYMKGSELYYDFYKPRDHEALATFVTSKLTRQQWLVSYDNVARIRNLYKGCQRMTYGLGYSARSARMGTEILFFSDSLKVCPLIGPFRPMRTASMTTKSKESLRKEGGAHRTQRSRTVISNLKKPAKQIKRLRGSRK